MPTKKDAKLGNSTEEQDSLVEQATRLHQVLGRYRWAEAELQTAMANLGATKSQFPVVEIKAMLLAMGTATALQLQSSVQIITEAYNQIPDMVREQAEANRRSKVVES